MNFQFSNFKIILVIFSTITFLLLAPNFVFAKPGDKCTSDSQCSDTKGSYCVILSSGNGVCGNPGESCASDNDCVKPQTCNTSTKLCGSPPASPQCPSGQTYDVQQKKCVTVTLSPKGGACCFGIKSGEILADCKDVTPDTQCSAFNNATTGINYSLQKKPCSEIGNCPQAAAAARSFTPSAPKEPPFVPIVPKLQINIPTVQFSNISKEGQMLGIPFLAEYFAGVYKYAVGIVSIIAIVVIMVGGLRWLTAGGSSGAITQAKQLISNATIGLVLILGSYILLYSINPDLVNFKALKIEYIKPQSFVVDFTDEQLKDYTGMTAGSGSGGVPLFVQWDDHKNSWANNHCGPNPSDTSKSTIARAGCGLTSYAMVLKYYFPSQNIDPGAVSLLSSSCSIGGLNASKLSKWGPVAIDPMGVKNLNKIQTLVSQGKPVVINCHPCVGLKDGKLSPRKYGGHLMVLTGYSNGTFSVNDPGSYFTSMTTEMITNPCKFIGPSDNNSKASDALSTCNKKAKGEKVKADPERPNFWYLRPAGK